MVVQAHGGADIPADGQVRQLRVVGENPDAVLIGRGEVPLFQPQLREGAEHPVGDLAPELALLDLLSPGEEGLVQGHRDDVPLLDVLGPGDDLDGLPLPRVHLADPHVVAVLMALHGEDLAHHHVLDLCAQVLRDLHLGTGEGHGLGKLSVIGVNGHKLAEPFSA